jgi:hypothetical protein
MPRILSNLKFWALTLSLVWIFVITLVIVADPGFAHGMK